MSKKIIIYQKHATKPIILTDNTDNEISEIKEDILNIMKSTKIITFETETDLLIIRPSEIQSVLISKDDNMRKEIKNRSELSQSLSLDKSND